MLSFLITAPFFYIFHKICLSFVLVFVCLPLKYKLIEVRNLSVCLTLYILGLNSALHIIGTQQILAERGISLFTFSERQETRALFCGGSFHLSYLKRTDFITGFILMMTGWPLRQWLLDNYRHGWA